MRALVFEELVQADSGGSVLAVHVYVHVYVTSLTWQRGGQSGLTGAQRINSENISPRSE